MPRLETEHAIETALADRFVPREDIEAAHVSRADDRNVGKIVVHVRRLEIGTR